MKRTGFDERRDQKVADDYLANHLPCHGCNASTPRDELSRLGARCQGCYDAYLAERNPAWWPNRPLTSDERKAVVRKATQGMRRIGSGQSDPKAWARGLRSRELDHGGVLANGTRMTDSQREAWRHALRYETVEEGADAC